MLRKLTKIISISFCLLGIVLFGAHAESIDSLQESLANASSDEKVGVLCRLSKQLIGTDPDEAYRYAQQAKKLAVKLSKDSLLADAYVAMAVVFHNRSAYDSALYYYNHAINLQGDNIKVSSSLNNIGVIYKELSNYDSAIVYHKQALVLEEIHGRDWGKAFTLNNIANVYLSQGKYDEALRYYNESLEIRRKNRLFDDVASSLNNIGNVYKKMDEYDKALRYLEMSLAICDSIGDKEKTANTLNSIGNFFRQRRSFDKAREYYEKSLQLKMADNDLAQIGNAYNNIGLVHSDIDNYAKALEYYNKAIENHKKANKTSSVAYTMNLIGGLYWKKHDYDSAVYYYKQALALREKIGNLTAIASSMKNIGILYKDQMDYRSALDWYGKASKIYMDLSDLQGLASISNLEGRLFQQINEFVDAEDKYHVALSMYEQAGNKQGIVALYFNLGDLYLSNKQFEKAEEYFQRTMELAKEIARNDLMMKASYALYEVYLGAGSDSKGLEYFVKYTQWKDSINTYESKKRIAEIEFNNAIKLKDIKIKEKDQKLLKSEEELEQQRIYIAIAAIVALIILVFLILFYIQKKKIHRVNLRLREKRKELEQANEKLEVALTDLSLMNQKVTDSINYAKRIQDALLPSAEQVKMLFAKNFILYYPKDIVSGDFYWITRTKEHKYIAAVDCTGHGVPGAFMSMIGSSLLNEIVHSKGITEPEDILKMLNVGVINALNQSDEHGMRNDDGMELTLCRVDREDKELTVAFANHKMVIVKPGQKPEFVSASFHSIGGVMSVRKTPDYEQLKMPIEKGMRLYLFSDGYIDQFNSERSKYSSPRMLEHIDEIQQYDIYEQFGEFVNEFDNWKGTMHQLDDVMLIGIEF